MLLFSRTVRFIIYSQTMLRVLLHRCLVEISIYLSQEYSYRHIFHARSRCYVGKKGRRKKETKQRTSKMLCTGSFYYWCLLCPSIIWCILRRRRSIWRAAMHTHMRHSVSWQPLFVFQFSLIFLAFQCAVRGIGTNRSFSKLSVTFK